MVAASPISPLYLESLITGDKLAASVPIEPTAEAPTRKTEAGAVVTEVDTVDSIRYDAYPVPPPIRYLD